MRAVGFNRDASQFAGMRVGNILLITALISGGLAGLAGYSEVTGLKGNLTLDLSPGFGYTGIVVAMLAQLHPWRHWFSYFRGMHFCGCRCHEPFGGGS